MDIQKLETLLTRVQKPARYSGGETGCTIKDKSQTDVRFAFCFPDKYEVGMSHLGIKILYGVLNSLDYVWCERVFAPDTDMEELMRAEGLPLYALESKDELGAFDFIGFTLQYELCYTNMLNMLDLAGLPVRSDRRGDELKNIVIAGGPCTCNPEPIADFVDIFSIGEGEEALPELMALYREAKREGIGKREFLRRASRLDGFYVPSLYTPEYNENGTLAALIPEGDTPSKITKRIIEDFENVFYPKEFVVPFTEAIHDRAVIEVMRGCIRGCRFCQAGFIYRPVREKSSEKLNQNARELCYSTGYEELSLCSLSTSDYTDIEPLLDKLLDWTNDDKVSLSLPSLRIDHFSKEVLDRVSLLKKNGLTFAPEAGTQRMRDVINKNITEEEILRTCRIAFEGGYTAVKLYFMIGLPGETLEDVAGIAELAQKVVDLYYSLPTKPKGRGVTVSASVSSFVPKPHTPFEFEPQDTPETLREKQKYLLSCVKSRKIQISWHMPAVSFLEGVFARGDRKICRVIESAWRMGCTFDAWDEHFKYDAWMKAFEENGVDPAFYANRTRPYDELMPWDHIFHGVDKSFLVRENERAKEALTTPNCRERCSGCGAAKLMGGHCIGHE